MSGASDGSPVRAGTVALVGWTNVGKSTLLNRLVGARLAAVANVAQTTRRRILGVCDMPGVAQLVFVDTPGFHRPKYRMNRIMVDTARQAILGVDLVVLVIDASQGPGGGDREAAQVVQESGCPSLVVLNKVDRVRPKDRLLPMIQTLVEGWGFGEVIPISATTGDGCDVLLERIVASLPVAEPTYPSDFLTDQPERVLVAEQIREKILRATREELPHATAVVVEGWRERDDGLIEIDVAIVVERESQKKIVIGRNGEVLKQVGIAARRDLEELLGCRLHLRTWVKVRREWRNDEKALRQLGLD